MANGTIHNNAAEILLAELLGCSVVAGLGAPGVVGAEEGLNEEVGPAVGDLVDVVVGLPGVAVVVVVVTRAVVGTPGTGAAVVVVVVGPDGAADVVVVTGALVAPPNTTATYTAFGFTR
jgi:hypothetical protein